MVQARSSLRTLKHKENKCKVGGRDTSRYIESLKIVPCVDVAVFFKNKNNKDYLPNDILTLSYWELSSFGIFCECNTDVLVPVSLPFICLKPSLVLTGMNIIEIWLMWQLFFQVNREGRMCYRSCQNAFPMIKLTKSGMYQGQ